MRLLKLVCFAIVFSSFAFSQSASDSSAPASSSELPKLEHFDVNMVDRSVDPCADFYKYACGKWMAANPIPADQSAWDVSGPLQIWNEMVLRETLEKAEQPGNQRTANEQRIGDYYFSCMNETQVNSTSSAELKPELGRIAKIKSKKDLAAELAHLHQVLPGAWQPSDDQTDAPMLGFTGQPDFADVTHNVAYVDQGGMGMPGRDFYINNDEKSKEIRGKYIQHVKNMLMLAGEDAKQAESDASVVLAMETEIAKAAMDPVTRRDPKNINHPMPLEQVKQLAPDFNWDEYLKLVNAPASPKYIVTSPEFFKALNKMIAEHPLDHWKAYLRWHLLHGSAPFLGDAFVNENFNFYNHTLFGAEKLQPRWRR